ncbi:uncharacterized protein LOC142177263 [Nicotiana tabacum]|uniref:Uncharacterized protein LOC142177263 n=1 Tax=Nicotiana tabacum TaxID=4097 RepID=A0AC58TX95_TOBAC
MDVFLMKFNSSQPSSNLRNNSSHLIDEFDEKLLNSDPGERVPIDKYSLRIRDEIRRHYIQNGPCQPVDHKFSAPSFGNKMRQFSPGWFKGQVNEPFIGLIRVHDTSAKSLKEAILSLLMKHSLSPSKIRRQGYDRASNMKGKMNGLKALILQETPSAYCIHCFAHQLQLTLVAIAKKYKEVETFFVIVANVLNVIGASFKRRDQLRDHHAELLEKLLESGEVQSEKGLNQEQGLQRLGDTRWGSHCKILYNFVILFASIVHVLGVIEYEGQKANDRLQAEAFLSKINSFEFVFMLHLMLKVLLMSNDLSKALQKKEQDIINAMIFLDLTKKRLQQIRDEG